MVLGLFFHEHKLLVVIFVFEGEFYLNVMSKICDYIEPLCFSELFHDNTLTAAFLCGAGHCMAYTNVRKFISALR